MIGRIAGRWFLGLGALWIGACSTDGARTTRSDAPPEQSGLDDERRGAVRGAPAVLGAARRLALVDSGLSAALLDRGSDIAADTGAGWVSAGFRAPVFTAGISGIAARLPANADQPFVVRQSVREDRRLEIVLEGARRPIGELVEGRVVYQDLYASTDAVWLADDWKLEELLVLRDDRSPRSFGWRVSFGSGVAGAREDSDGGVSFVDAGDEMVFHVPRPFALDARGERRDAELDWSGDRLTVSLDPTGLVYPILLDPVVEGLWETLSPTGNPGARQATNLAYDSQRARSVLFGGVAAGAVVHCDTWELGFVNGDWEWSARFNPAACPTTAGTMRARGQHATAYDTTNQRTLVFGGFIAGESVPTSELWMLGSGGAGTWTECDGACATAVPGRYNTAMVFDTARSVAVVFGGIDGLGEFLCDTWEWSSASESWTRRQNPTDCSAASAVNPSGRHGMAMAYDQSRGVTVLYGGQSASGLSGQVWEWSSANFTWTQRCTTAPCSTGTRPGVLRLARMAYDSAIKRVVLYGGENATAGANGIQSGVWLWDGTEWTSLGSVTGPLGRRNHAMAFDASQRRTIAFGGQVFGTGANSDATYALHTRGNDCNANADCDTNHCVTDTAGAGASEVDTKVCCNEACTGTCRACTSALKQGGGSDGVCGFAATGTDPHGDCTDQGAASCGTNGNCDGSGGCQYYSASTQCAAASCSGSTFTPARTCDAVAHACSAANPQSCNGYVCLNSTACRTSCTQDSHCASGYYCNESGACEEQKAQGSQCSSDDCYLGGACNMCGSAGGCVDGRCCNTTCGADCQKCDGSPAGSTPGVCATVLGAVGTGTPDAPQCTGTETCSPTGACLKANGQAESSGANCASGNSSDGVCCNTACTGTCNACTAALGASASGTCTNLAPGSQGVSNGCAAAGYLCAANGICPSSCDADADCAPTHYCNASGQCAARKANGATCVAASECFGGGACRLCSSTHCVDGRCCEGACDQACESCANASGSCSPVTNGPDPDHCAAATNTCDANGDCKLQTGRGPCSSGADCASGHCVDGICCGSACDPCERCDAQGSLGTCTPLTNTEDPGTNGCSDTGYCDATGACRNKGDQGAACSSTLHCLSPYSCEDDVCCNVAGCEQQACRACTTALKGAGADGVCGAIVAGTDPREACDENTSTNPCGPDGMCNGAGDCRTAAPNTKPCGPTTCTANNVGVQGQLCNEGTCSPGGGQSCAPFLCLTSGTSGACATSCTSDTDCAAGAFCTSGARRVCQNKFGLGAECGGNNECNSNYCVDGRCCSGACNTACRSCDNANGTCTTVVRNEEDDNCDGASICDAEGACKLKQTSGGCSANSECVTGRCVDGHCCADSCSTPCRSCDNASGTCTTRVTDEDDDTCDGANTCDPDGACKKKRGQPCEEADECTTALCVDGFCCDDACEGTCEACDVAGEEGTCTLVEGDPHGDRTPCDGEPGTTCAGTCDGTDVDCSYPGASESCGSSCTGERVTRRVCDGRGRCEDQAPATCGLYACDEAAGVCRTTCEENAHCAASTACSENGRCISAGAVCLDQATLRDAEGNSIDCSPFQCRVDRCLETCESVDDCTGDTVCNASGRCVPRSSARAGADEDAGCGCRQGPARSSDARTFALFALVGILVLRRRTAAAKFSSRAA